MRWNPLSIYYPHRIFRGVSCPPCTTRVQHTKRTASSNRPFLFRNGGQQKNKRDIFAETVGSAEAEKESRVFYSRKEKTSNSNSQNEEEKLRQSVKMSKNRNFAVSDDIYVAGFGTRFSLTSSLFHRPPESTDHPTVHLLRRCGARFQGKLRCSTPCGIADGLIDFDYRPPAGTSAASQISKGNEEKRSGDKAEDASAVQGSAHEKEGGGQEVVPYAASAVAEGLCDFSLCASVIGGAGLNSPTAADVVGFAPTRGALPRATLPPLSRTRSLGFVGRSVASMADLWTRMEAFDHTNTISESRKKYRQDEEEEESGSAGAQEIKCKHADDKLVLGVPTRWLEDVNNCRPGTAVRFAAALAELLKTGNDKRKGKKQIVGGANSSASSSAADRKHAVQKTYSEVILRPVEINWDTDRVLQAALTIARYEITEAIVSRNTFNINQTDNEEDEEAEDGDTASEGGVSEDSQLEKNEAEVTSVTANRTTDSDDGMSSLIEQLPRWLLDSFLLPGQQITNAQYQQARMEMQELMEEYEEAVEECDCLIMPLSHSVPKQTNISTHPAEAAQQPHIASSQSGSGDHSTAAATRTAEGSSRSELEIDYMLRRFATTIPFAMMGCPMISFRATGFAPGTPAHRALYHPPITAILPDALHHFKRTSDAENGIGTEKTPASPRARRHSLGGAGADASVEPTAHYDTNESIISEHLMDSDGEAANMFQLLGGNGAHNTSGMMGIQLVGECGQDSSLLRAAVFLSQRLRKQK